MSTDSRSILEVLEERVGRLKAQPLSALQQMPPIDQFRVRLTHDTYDIAVWKDDLSDGSTRLVVQAYMHFALGVGRMTARGFVVSGAGIRDLGDQELLEFM